MTADHTKVSRHPLPYIIILICWVAYVALSLMSPHTPTAPSVANPARLIIRFSIFIPVLLIWVTAIRGALTFKAYAKIIHESPEAASLGKIANALFWLVGYIVAITLVGAVVPYFTESPILASILVLRDHLPAFITLIAFIQLYQGSHQLKKIADFATWSPSTIWFFIGYAIFCLVFVLTFAANAGMNSAQAINRNSSSVLPPAVLLVTLILPYLAAWFIGLLASINIAKFSYRVKGIIYRRALKDLVFGIWSIVLFAMVLQLLTFTIRILLGLSLVPILALLYALLLLYALGFMLIYSGAKKLTRIEVLE